MLDWDILHKEVWQPSLDLYQEMASTEQKRRNLIRRPAEPEDAYASRVRSAYLENYFAPALRSYSALLGKFEFTHDAPEEITESDKDSEEGRIASDIDLNGNDYRAFLAELNIMALCLGASICVVDVREDKNGKRPYLKRWDLDEIYYKSGKEGNYQFKRGMVTEIEEGKTYVQSFAGRYESLEINDDGELETCEYYLEYENNPARTTLWKIVKGKAEKQWNREMIGANGLRLMQIPVVWHDFAGNPIGKPSLPPLFSLARLNIAHFNSLSELQTILTVVNGPTPYRIWPEGQPLPEERPDMYLGINSVADMPGGAKLGFMEPSGNGMSLSWDVIQGQIQQMQSMGQKFLSAGEKAKTATEAILESSQAETALLNLANRVENTTEEIFKFWEVFSDPTYEYPDYAGGIKVSTESLYVRMLPAEIQATLQNFLNGLIDGQTALNILVRRGAMKQTDLSPALLKLLNKEEDDDDENEEETGEEIEKKWEGMITQEDVESELVKDSQSSEIDLGIEPDFTR